MARIICRKNGSEVQVEISGSGLLKNAGKAREFFLTLLKLNSRQCRIDLTGIHEIDMPFVQLLLSFIKSMKRQGGSVSFAPLQHTHIIMMSFSNTGIPEILFSSDRGRYGL